MEKRTYTIAEAARRIGISKSTLLYWFRVRQIEDVARDYNGWRVFTDEDIKRLKAFRDRGKADTGVSAPTQGVGAERRQWMRVRAGLPVRYEFRGNGSGALAEGLSETRDISLGGAMFEADLRVLPLGNLVVEISLPESNGSIASGAEVRWARRRNGGNLLGVQFTDLQDIERKLISEYIGRCVATEG